MSKKLVTFCYTTQRTMNHAACRHVCKEAASQPIMRDCHTASLVAEMRCVKNARVLISLPEACIVWIESMRGMPAVEVCKP